MRPGATSSFTRSHPFAPASPTPFPELPTDSQLRGTGGATGCNLVIYEVAPVRTRIPNTVPRTTDGFPTSRNWRCDRVQPRNYEVAPVRSRIPNTVPRTTDGFPTSRNWRCDRVQPRNLRGRTRSQPNPKHRSPRTTDGFPTSRNWRCDRVQPHNLRGRTRIPNTIPRTTDGFPTSRKERLCRIPS